MYTKYQCLTLLIPQCGNKNYKGESMSYEPPLDDDIALDKNIDDSDVYTEPDRMWDDE